MNVLVTGGSGFIGRHLVSALHNRGDTVTVLSRRSSRVVPLGVAVLRCDLGSPHADLGEAVENCDVVFHCAGEIHDSAQMHAIHVSGTQRLVAAVEHQARRAARRPLHWVQLSSVGAYGESQSGPSAERVVTEETPTQPMNEYERTKTRSDEIVVHAGGAGALTYSIVRPSNIVAPDMPNQSLRAMTEMIRRGLFFYIGHPGAIATYVHVEDVVGVLLRCGTDPRATNQVFNVSNDCHLEEVVNAIATALGVASPWLRFPESVVRATARIAAAATRHPLTQARISALVRRTSYPHDKIQQVLGYAPRRTVPVAIAEML